MKTLQTKPKAPQFGVPSLQVTSRIDNSDKCAALNAAAYRYGASLRELEQHFETKANDLREAYLNEVAAVHGEYQPAE